MNPTHFYRVQASAVPPEIESEVVQFSVEQGASGSAESLLFHQPDLTFDARVQHRGLKSIDIFFENEPPSEYLLQLKQLYPKIQFQVFKEEHRDWLSEWKKGYESFCLTSPYWVVPSWLESPVTPDETIHIDPGMAFGTGTHATTQIAARLVKEILSNKINRSESTVLDIGTGTGILAILADKLGAGTVIGVDIDPECLRVSKENAQRNQAQNLIIEDAPIDRLRSNFDVIIANIIDGVLMTLQKDILRLLNSNGDLILSGILSEREEGFISNFIENGNLSIERRLEKDGWVGFWVKPRGQS